MNKWFYPSALVTWLIFSMAGSAQTNRPVMSGEPKQDAPAFNVISLEGETFQLANLRGKVVVLNFWFTGCEPCVAEFKKLNALVDKFNDKEVVFLAPTLDNVTTLKPFLTEHTFKYHVVPNAGSLIVTTYRDGSGSVVFPTHIVIDKEGKVDTRVTGAKHIGDVRKAIVRLLSSG